MAYRLAQYRPTQTGFMEPISRKTYYEDQYSTSKPHEEEHETLAIDLFDSSGEDDGNNTKAEQKRQPADVLSRGLIKRSKYRSRATQATNPGPGLAQDAEQVKSVLMAKRQFKISPRRNARHSIRLSSKGPRQHHEAKAWKRLSSSASNFDQERKQQRQLFLEEKAWQRSLSGLERFNQARQQRQEIREQRHKAGEKARKVRERFQRDVAIAEACLVQDVPISKDFHILVKKSDAPADFIDFTRPEHVTGRHKGSKASENCPPKRNWKGQRMVLTEGAGYVLVKT